MLKPEEEPLLSVRASLTTGIKDEPYDYSLYVKRAGVYEELGYPDLAAFDAYKALLLLDELTDDSGEYHELALSAISKQVDYEVTEIDDTVQSICGSARSEATITLARALVSIGCLRFAYTFVEQFLQTSNDLELQQLLEKIKCHIKRSNDPEKSQDFEVQSDVLSLPDQGYVRREVYPWNGLESDRISPESLQLLNEEIRLIAPKVEVKVTELPLLYADSGNVVDRQLGLFATEDIAAGEEVLRERSLLTTNARLLEPLCDACSSVLPDLDSFQHGSTSEARRPVPCAECDDTIFCSQTCHDLAQESYHPALCGADVDAISKDVPASKAADALYTLLLHRSLAMSLTQDRHALDLPEVRNICGEFSPVRAIGIGMRGEANFKAHPRTLPFSFNDNILAPLHMLEKMDVDIFASRNDIAELWVWNTLYAKLRATASARISTRDGRPEVAAVHPFWCLANHSCDPNVGWEWAGEIHFTARKTRVAWKRKVGDGKAEERPARPGGIRAGEEILNHYVDIDLSARERRDWGAGVLGGSCRCERCVWEANES